MHAVLECRHDARPVLPLGNQIQQRNIQLAGEREELLPVGRIFFLKMAIGPAHDVEAVRGVNDACFGPLLADQFNALGRPGHVAVEQTSPRVFLFAGGRIRLQNQAVDDVSGENLGCSARGLSAGICGSTPTPSPVLIRWSKSWEPICQMTASL